MKIKDLVPDNQQVIQRVAHLLLVGFEHQPHAWPDMDAALTEVRESLEPDRISRIAVNDEGTILGWIGAIREYNGYTWQLHPLVVHPEHQNQGIGRALVIDLERLVRERGAFTLYLGTDDVGSMTSLSNTDLYPDVTQHITNIENLRRHPYEFYQRLGFVIVGVIPDANGLGKPDIIMAKRVAGENDDRHTTLQV